MKKYFTLSFLLATMIAVAQTKKSNLNKEAVAACRKASGGISFHQRYDGPPPVRGKQ